MDLKQLVMLGLQVSIVCTVFGYGLKTRTAALVGVARRPALLVRSVICVLVVMPALAFALTRLFAIRHEVEIALVALAISPVPPLLPMKEGKAGARVSYGLGLLALLALVSIATIPLAIDTLPQNVPFIKDGKLRAIAVTSPARAPMAPAVPSVQELGQKKLVAENFLGISGPAGLPREVVKRVHAANRKALADPRVAQRLAELGVQGRDMSPEEFTAFVAAQVKDWYQPVKDSGAKLN